MSSAVHVDIIINGISACVRHMHLRNSQLLHRFWRKKYKIVTGKRNRIKTQITFNMNFIMLSSFQF